MPRFRELKDETKHEIVVILRDAVEAVREKTGSDGCWRSECGCSTMVERTILQGDALTVLRTMASGSSNCCVTSPPYWGLRDYGVEEQLGLERAPEEYVGKLVEVFREVRRVLRDDGTLWLNLGDCYTPTNRGENARPRRETLTGISVGNPHSDIPTRKSVIQAVAAMGLKPKDLVGIPWRVAFALQADGWWLRQDIIWAKPNPMPESVTDRPTKAHEYIFLLAKSERYYYDARAIKEPGVAMTLHGATGSGYSAPGQTSQNGNRKIPAGWATGPGSHGTIHPNGQLSADKQRGHGRRHAGFNDRWDSMTREEQCAVMRNKRSVWTVATHPFSEAHFATFPPDLIRPCILAGCPEGGTVLDPFFGAGTTGLVAKQEGRGYIGIELNPAYIEMAKRRIEEECPMERLV